MRTLSFAILFMLLTASFSLKAQHLGPCGTTDAPPLETRAMNCSNTGTDWLTKYRTPGYWIPNANTPIKTILVNIVVCQKDDGTGGWIDSPQFRDQVDLMFVKLNEIYGNSLPRGYTVPCMPAYTHVNDTRIRWELNEIIFIPNTTFHYASNVGPIMNHLLTNYPAASEAMNHIFTMPTTPQGYWGSYSTYSGYSYVQTYGSMFSDWYFVWDDHVGHFAHEYGHAVGLHHQYDGEVRQVAHYDFLDDIFGTCPVLGSPCTNPPNATPPAGYVSYLQGCYFNAFAGPNPLMSAAANGRYISPKSAGRMHRALSMFGNYFVVGNQPMHQYVKEKTSYAVPLNITANETWDFAIKMYQDIVVKPGKTLTITCEVRMPIGGRIIVEPGGKLVVDGGKITSAHNQRWNGIELWGNTAVAQTISGGYYPQAWLVLKNDAIIENANNAVTTWKFNDWSKTGGLIHATDATFRNNSRSVEFRYYPGFTDKSYFTNCKFVIDAPLVGGGHCNSMVTAENIKGMTFRGCTFECTDNTLYGIYPLPKGIYTHNAGFTFTTWCNMSGIPPYPCPTANMVPNKFNGLLTGVEALNGSNNTFKVDSAWFDNCATGVKSSFVNQFEVVRSRFTLSPFYMTMAANGLMHDNGTGFKIENNHFRTTMASPHSYNFVGLTSSQTGSAANEIYNNRYTNLRYGNWSDGTNWLGGISTNPLGLKYKCNIQEGNRYDITVNTGTIGQNQGTVVGATYTPAGNTFSTTTYPTGHFNHLGTNLVSYVHHDQSLSALTVKPTQRTVGNVVLTEWVGTGLNRNSYCPSRLSWGGIIVIPIEKSLAGFREFKKAYDQLYETYTSLPEDPSEKGMQVRKEMEAALSHYAEKYHLIANDMIRYFQEQQPEGAIDSIMAWNSRKGDFASMLSNADLMAGQLNYADAGALVDRLSAVATEAELREELSSRAALYSLLSAMPAYWQLEKSHQDALFAFAGSGVLTAHMQARNLLAFYYGYEFEPVVYENGMTGGTLATQDHTGDAGSRLRVFPNPSSGQSTFEYHYPGQERLQLEIFMVSGVKLSSTTLPGNTGSYAWSSGELSAGVYVYTISANGTLLDRGMLQLVK